MRNTHRTIAAIVTLALIAAVRFCNAEDTAAPQPPAAKPRVTISKETTYITKPLRPDGYPDYVAALNELLSQGVTQENNAAVLIMQAIGPLHLPKEYRKDLFQKLGVAALSEQGEYYRYLDEMATEADRAQDPEQTATQEENLEELQVTCATHRWNSKNYPEIARWVNKNSVPLDTLVAASKRTHCYFPLPGGVEDRSPINLYMPFEVEPLRDAVKALLARSMLRLNDGQTLAAIEDLLACHRLARMISHGPSIIHSLTGLTLHSFTCEATCSILHHGNLNHGQIDALATEIEQLPSFRSMADCLDRGERLMNLAGLSWVERQGAGRFLPAMQKYLGAEDTAEEKNANGLMLFTIIYLLQDWDAQAIAVNDAYNKFSAAARLSDPKEKIASAIAWNDELTELAKRLKRREFHNELVFGPNRRQAMGRQIGRIAAHVTTGGFDVAIRAETAIPTWLRLHETALGLARYRFDKKEYPSKLTDLVPKYFAALPLDPLAPEPREMQYRREGDGYSLYSVGYNGVDDGGMSGGENDADDWIAVSFGKK